MFAPSVGLPSSKHRLALAGRLLGLLLLLGWPGLGWAEDETLAPLPRPPDLSSVVASGRLRVAMTRFEIPPFHYHNAEGQLIGRDVDMIKGLAASLKLKAEIIDSPRSFNEVIDMVADGRADIGVSKISQTYDRLMRVRFSDPYMTLHHAMLFNRLQIGNKALTRKPQEVLRNFDERLGVIGDSAYVDFASRNFPKARIVQYPTWELVIQALQDGEVEAIYRDEFEIRQAVKKNPILNVKFGISVVKDQTSFLTIAICDSCAKLQDFVNYYIAQNGINYTIEGLLADMKSN